MINSTETNFFNDDVITEEMRSLRYLAEFRGLSPVQVDNHVITI